MRHVIVKWLFSSAVLAAAFIGFQETTQAQSKVSISIAHISTLNAPNVRNTVGVLRDALQATGMVEVTLYGQGSAYADPTKFTDVVRRGVVDITFGSPQFEAGRYPIVNLIGEPFVASDHLRATRAIWTFAHSSPEARAEFSSVKLIALFCASPEQFHAVKTLESLDDLKGMRVMTTNQGLMDIIREIGGSTVALPTSAQYEQLQKGVVGATSTSWTGVYSFGTNEVTNGHLEASSVMTPVMFIMNKDKYDGLPPEIKKVIDDFSTIDAALRFARAWDETDRLGRDGALKKGASIVTLSQAERSAARARFRHLTDARLTELEKKGVPAKRLFTALTLEIDKAEAN